MMLRALVFKALSGIGRSACHKSRGRGDAPGGVGAKTEMSRRLWTKEPDAAFLMRASMSLRGAPLIIAGLTLAPDFSQQSSAWLVRLCLTTPVTAVWMASPGGRSRW